MIRMLVAVVLSGAAMVTTATGSASASSAWSNRSNLPQGVGDGAAATAPCVGDLSANCAYIVGGRNFASNGLTATDQYDVASNQWTSVASLSIGRYQSGASAGPCLSDQTKTCVYAVGGTDSDGSFLNSVEVFNPASDAWGTGPTVPTPNAPSNFTGRSQLATAAGPCFTDTAQTCIYAIGGYNQALYNLATVEMLNPSTGTWTNAASLNTARSRLAAAAAPCVGNGAHTCLYAIGGTGTNGFLSSVEMFDPWTNTWAYEGGLIVSGTSTPYPVAGMAAAAGPCPSDDSRTCLFAWGGQDKTYAILGATMIFDPANNSWSYGPALNTARDNLAGTAAPCGGDVCLYALGGDGSTYFANAESLDLGHGTSAASLTITANDKSVTYGGPMPALTWTGSGYVNGDTAASLQTPPTCSDGASSTPSGNDASGVGAYAITCTGAVDPSYTISYVAGELTVSPAVLTITPVNLTVAYGGILPKLTWRAKFVNGDTQVSLSTQPVCTTSAKTNVAGAITSAAGVYPLTCKSAVDPNYSISYAAGTVTVTRAATSIVYGGPKTVTRGAKAVFKVTLTSGSSKVAGRRMTVELGSGTGKQSCTTGLTAATGTASCTIASIKQPLGTVTLTAAFAGDPAGSGQDYAPTTKVVTLTVKS